MSKLQIDVLAERLLTAHARKRRVERGALILLMTSGALLSFFAYFILDYATDIPWFLRPTTTIVLLLLFAVYLPRRMRRGKLHHPTVAEVAREVEAKALAGPGGGFKSILVSAAEFSLKKFSTGSVALAEEVVKEAHAERYNPLAVHLHDTRLVRKSARTAIAAGAVLLLWLLTGTASLAVFLGRAVGMPLEYPTKTVIVEVTCPKYAAQRQDLPIVVEAKGELPSAGKARVAYDGESAFAIPLDPDPKTPGRYQFVIRDPSKSLTFSASLGDAKTGTYRVEVIPPPFVKEGKVTIKPPDYTKEPERTYALGDFDIPERSRFSFTITPDREVESCYFQINEARHNATKRKDANTFSLDVAQLGKTVVYCVGLVDKHGIENIDKVFYRMGVIPDRPPAVVLEKPEHGIYCSPISKLSWRVKSVDDYGLLDVRLAYTVMRKNEKGDAVKVCFGELPVAKLGGEKDSSLAGTVDLKEIKLEPGQTIDLQALARDNSGFNDPGKSAIKTLSVVAPEELRRVMEEEALRAHNLVKDIETDMKHQKSVIELLINKDGAK